MSANSVESPSVDWNSILEPCLPHLSLHDLVRLSTCSKSVGWFISNRLNDGRSLLARRLLRRTLQEAARQDNPSNPEQQTQQKAVRWLLAIASHTPDLLQQGEYFSIPRVPLHLCEELVAAGLKVTQSQLLSAARSRVEQVENWVYACIRQGLDTGLEPIMGVACCPGLEIDAAAPQQWPSTSLRFLTIVSPGLLEDVLYLALNTLGRKPLAVVVDPAAYEKHIYHETAQLVSWLVKPATITGASWSWRVHLTPEACTRLLLFLTDISAERAKVLKHAYETFHELFHHLRKLPGVQQMSAEDAHSILQKAVQSQLGHTWVLSFYVRNLPGVQRLSADCIFGLMKASMQRALQPVDSLPGCPLDWITPAFTAGGLGHTPDVILALSETPSAGTLPAEAWKQVYQIFLDGLQSHGCSVIYKASMASSFLLEIPCMQQLNIAAVITFMQSVVELNRRKQIRIGSASDLLRQLCGLPAAVAAGITVADAQELLLIWHGHNSVDGLSEKWQQLLSLAAH